jgi:signal-transduction protein with cAMP-binding, CBS, and nucleotidyltransferase domain
MNAGSICSRVVATAAPAEKIRVAARRMAANDVGTLVVLDTCGHHEAVGIVTDRDITLRCVAGDLDPDTADVSMVMTQPVASINEWTGVDTAIAKMAANGTRRLIVTGEGQRVVGILSLDDVLEVLARELGPIGQLLEQQQPHIPA